MQTAPAVILSSIDCVGRQGVSFDITANGMEVFVVLDRKASKPPLVNVAMPRRSVVSVIPLRMGERNPTDKSGHAAIFEWRQNHVPVIFHPLVGNQIDGELL